MEVRISGVHYPLETLGPGRRLGVWFQGCSLACAGCMSRHTWDTRGGTPVQVPDVLARWEAALAAGAAGLTVSGGEPLQQADALAELLAGADRLRGASRRERGAAGAAPVDLLVYTGYEFEELTPGQRHALSYADAVVTGRFRVAEPTRLVWRGSANQRIRPLTPRGAVRYGPHLARETDGARLQVETGTESPAAVRVYGVPLRGEMTWMERRLKESGVTLSERSWRP
ncbi:4Fe-4S single cluster domain-containing protein [Streptomyces sp. NPDC046931]|uniref:4Fe-4S single cluster domain-containing protein n=1 Tax=Streptomyces sp. NPDC046931 TaxID=3154806 RepID=UPI0033E84CF4